MSRIRTDALPTTPGTVIDIEILDEDESVSWERLILVDRKDNAENKWLSLDDQELWNISDPELGQHKPGGRWQLVSVPVTETEGAAIIPVGGFAIESPTERAWKAVQAIDPATYSRTTRPDNVQHTLESLIELAEVLAQNITLQMSTASQAAGYGSPEQKLLGAWYHTVNATMGEIRIALRRMVAERDGGMQHGIVPQSDADREVIAILDKHPLMVVHGGHDMESHARSFNQGYSTALAHAETDDLDGIADLDVPEWPTFEFVDDKGHRALVILQPGYINIGGIRVQRLADLHAEVFPLREVTS